MERGISSESGALKPLLLESHSALNAATVAALKGEISLPAPGIIAIVY